MPTENDVENAVDAIEYHLNCSENPNARTISPASIKVSKEDIVEINPARIISSLLRMSLDSNFRKKISTNCYHPSTVWVNIETEEIFVPNCSICYPSSRSSFHSLFRDEYSSYGNFFSPHTKYEKIRLPYTFGVEVECNTHCEFTDKLASEANVTTVPAGFCKLFRLGENFVLLKQKEDLVSPKRKNLGILSGWICASDGSIRAIYDHNCYEFKSPILNGDHGIDHLAEFFDIIKPVFNDSCGLHVHLASPDDLRLERTGERLDIRCTQTDRNLILLYPIIDSLYHPQFMNRRRLNSNYAIRPFISGRDEDSSGQGNFSRFSRFIKILFKIKNSNRIVSEFADLRHMLSPSNHFSSTSYYTNHGTIEFRQMGGTDNIEYITKNINAYQATLHLAVKLTLQEVVEIARYLFDVEDDSQSSIAKSYDKLVLPIIEGVRTKDTVSLRNKVDLLFEGAYSL